MDNEKTKGEKNSIIKKLFPIIFGIFAILEYLYFPNHQKNMKATPVYLYFY